MKSIKRNLLVLMILGSLVSGASAGLIYENGMLSAAGWTTNSATLTPMVEGSFKFLRLYRADGDPANMDTDINFTIVGNVTYTLTAWIREAGGLTYDENGMQFKLMFTDTEGASIVQELVPSYGDEWIKYSVSFSTDAGSSYEEWIGKSLAISLGSEQPGQVVDTAWVGVDAKLVPEPATLALLGSGFAGLFIRRRK
jgi:hypothetical protein